MLYIFTYSFVLRFWGKMVVAGGGWGGGKIIKYYDCISLNFSCHYTRLKIVINYQSKWSVALRLSYSVENRFILEIFRDVQSYIYFQINKKRQYCNLLSFSGKLFLYILTI